MTNEIDASIIANTQQKLGRYIQRPQLTDKLLKRPPFRFLHDIVTTAIRQYGVLEQVFERHELSSENLKEKEAKIMFLHKLINHLSSKLGEELNVKPSKIVAGSEADRTNELLVALAKVLETKQKAESKTKPKEPKAPANKTPTNKGLNENNTKTAVTTKKTEKRTEQQVSKSNTNVKAKPMAVVAKSTAAKIDTASKETAKKQIVNGERTLVKSEEASPKRIPSSAATASESTVNQPRETSAVKEPAKEISSAEKDEGTAKVDDPISNKKQSFRVTSSHRVAEGPPPVSVRTQKEKSGEEQPVVDNNGNMSNGEGPRGSPDSGILIEHPKSAPSPIPPDSKPQGPPSGRPPQRSEASGRRRPPSSSGLRRSHPGPPPATPPVVAAAEAPPESEDAVKISVPESEDAGNVSAVPGQLSPHMAVVAKETFERPPPVRPSASRRQNSMTSASMRPKSSRRPPSRSSAHRDRLTLVRSDTRGNGGLAVPHVILDGNSLPSDDSEDDSEDRIVEAAVLDGDLPFGHVEGPSIGGFSKQPGKLVEQILSAQREFVDTDEAQVSGGDEGVGGVGPTDRLRTLVQEVAQAALPLAQLIPLIHEDLQVMHDEWLGWRREADRLQEQLELERQAAQSSTEQMREQLALLDAAVDGQRAKLNAARASLLRSENDVGLLISNFGNHR